MPKPQHVHEIYVRASPERVWAALTDPEQTKRYYDGWLVGSSWEVGAPYEYLSDEGTVIAGEIEEIEPPRRLVMTFTFVADAVAASESPSRVTWELEPGENGLTLLTVVHDQLEGAPKTAASVAGPGWMRVLSGLKTLLETGESL